MSKNSLGLCILKWVVLCYKIPLFGWTAVPKATHHVWSQSHLVEWKRAREYEVPGPVRDFASDSLECSSVHGPFLTLGILSENQIDRPHGWEKEKQLLFLSF